jgi:O-antigen/teichoic acid export membrane protein
MITRFLNAEFRRIRNSDLARNAGWMLLGQGISFLLQASYFVLLARLLGVKEYGIFAGAFAFVGIATPFSTIGSGLVFLRHVTTNRENYAPYLGNIILSTFLAGTFLSVGLRIVAPYVLSSAGAQVVLFIAIANCLFSQLVASMGLVFQAFERLKMTASLNILTNALRLITVAIMTATLPHATARNWALASVGISAMAAAIGFFLVSCLYGTPKFKPRLIFLRAAEGVGFSLGCSAQSVYNDIDKTLLSHYRLDFQNGIYSMAYRVVDIATMPVASLDAAALPRYMQGSSLDIKSVPVLAHRLAWRAALIGLSASAGLFLTAPLIPWVVGHGFDQSVTALRWLCLLPALRGVHQLTGSAITGMGYQRFRTMAQFGAAFINLCLNLWLIPRYGWLGAAWSSLATDGLLGVVNWLIIKRISYIAKVFSIN